MLKYEKNERRKTSVKNLSKNYKKREETDIMSKKLNEKNAIMVSDFGQYIILGKVIKTSNDEEKASYEITSQDFSCDMQEVDKNLLFSQIGRKADGVTLLKGSTDGDIFGITSDEELRVFLINEYTSELIQKTFISGYDRASIDNIVAEAVEKGIIQG